MPIATDGSIHAQIMLVTIRIISAERFIIIASKERVEEVSGERLCAHLIVTPIQVDRLFQTKRMNSFQAFTLDFNLLGIREVAQGHPTVIQSVTTLLLFGAQRVEV